ncbi:MAG TPA: hypothetical protein VF402_09315, partial [Asticcacaulis sp.]
EVQDARGDWRKLAEQAEGQDTAAVRAVETEAREGRKVRIRLRAPAGYPAGLAELRVSGALHTD